MSALQQQSEDSAAIDTLRQQLVNLSSTGAPTADVKDAADAYLAARKKYTDKYGVSWGENHHKAVTTAYMNQLAGGAPVALPAGTPIPGALTGVTVGAKVKLTSGQIGEVIGPSTTSMGAPGVQIQLPDGTIHTYNVGSAKKLTAAEEAQIAAVPAVGESTYYIGLGKVTVASTPYLNASNTLVVDVLKSDGTTTKVSVAALGAGPPSTTTSSGDTVSVGDTVDTVAGPGVIITITPSGKIVEVQHSDGTKSIVGNLDVSVLPPAAATATTTPSAPPPG